MVNNNLQNAFLDNLCNTHAPVTIFLHNSFQINGWILHYDDSAILVEVEGVRKQLIYKHYISTIRPEYY